MYAFIRMYVRMYVCVYVLVRHFTQEGVLYYTLCLQTVHTSVVSRSFLKATKPFLRPKVPFILKTFANSVKSKITRNINLRKISAIRYTSTNLFIHICSLQEFTEEGLPFLLLFYAPGDEESKKLFKQKVQEEVAHERSAHVQPQCQCPLYRDVPCHKCLHIDQQ